MLNDVRRVVFASASLETTFGLGLRRHRRRAVEDLLHPDDGGELRPAAGTPSRRSRGRSRTPSCGSATPTGPGGCARCACRTTPTPGPSPAWSSPCTTSPTPGGPSRPWRPATARVQALAGQMQRGHRHRRRRAAHPRHRARSVRTTFGYPSQDLGRHAADRPGPPRRPLRHPRRPRADPRRRRAPARRDRPPPARRRALGPDRDGGRRPPQRPVRSAPSASPCGTSPVAWSPSGSGTGSTRSWAPPRTSWPRSAETGGCCMPTPRPPSSSTSGWTPMRGQARGTGRSSPAGRWSVTRPRPCRRSRPPGPGTGELALTKDGREIPLSCVLVAHRDDDGHIDRISSVSRDISDTKLFEERLRHQATHDDLTGLPNRVLLSTASRWRWPARPALETGVAVLFCDVDRFKVVNDSLGHGVGDELLKEVGERLAAERAPGRHRGPLRRRRVRPAVLGPHLAPGRRRPRPSGSRPRCGEPISAGDDRAGRHPQHRHRLRRAGHQPAQRPRAGRRRRHVPGQVPRPGPGRGLRRRPAPPGRSTASTPSPACAGRSTTGGSSSTTSRSSTCGTTRCRASRPSCAGSTPSGACSPPREFMEVAEETGLIVPLGRHLFAEACQQTVDLAAEPGADELNVFVNFSAAQLRHADRRRRRRHRAGARPGIDPALRAGRGHRARPARRRGRRRGPDRRAQGPRPEDRHRRLRHRLLVACRTSSASRSTC